MSALRQSLKAAALLGGCALVAVGLLSGIHALTAERIAEAERARELATLAIVLPPSRYDNDPVADAIAVHAPAWLGSDETLPVLRARRAGEPAALVLTTVAAGYAGPIRLLVGVDASGRVLGARVLRHRETPGLGDWIEADRSDWILGFAGRSLDDPPQARWRVRKDGGAFDQFAGATVTPRAVVTAMRRLLQYVDRHGAALYAAAPGTRLEHHDEARRVEGSGVDGGGMDNSSIEDSSGRPR